MKSQRPRVGGKKVSLLLLYLDVLTQVSPAQTEISFGPAVGMSFNQHKGSNIPSNANAVGLIIGGQFDIAFSKSVGLLATIAYDNKVGKYTDAGTIGGIDYSTNASITIAYCTVEPLFQYTLPNRPVYFVTGPSLGIPVQGKTQTTSEILTPGYSFPNGYALQTLNTTVDNMKARFEWKIGAGYCWHVDKKTFLNVHAIYSRVFTDVVDKSDWRVNAITLVGSFEFTLGR
ncbi:MAG TPA: outer membrane beta-barrel protein [Bacteroidota bacterium]|nr:outer membrane beta-barrel protein [Bacteroidota bacterium]